MANANAIGINLYSVYEELDEDYIGTLGKLSQMGYRNIELLSKNPRTGIRISDTFDAGTLRAAFGGLNLNPVASHEMIPQGLNLLEYDWDNVISFNTALECPGAVIPWLHFNSVEETLHTAEQLNRIGARLKEHGLQLYYHNHGHEFRTVGGRTLFDLLAEQTDAELLKFELDVIWIVLAGFEPLDVIRQLGPRCELLHQNELIADSPFDLAAFFAALEQMEQTGGDIMSAYFNNHMNWCDDLGAGIFDFASFYREVNEAGHVRYSIVENETTNGGKLARVEKDLQFIRRFI